MEQRRVVRVMNDIRALEAMAKAMRVQVKNLKRSLKFAGRELEFEVPSALGPVQNSVIALDNMIGDLHNELTALANAHGIHVPEDNEDGGIIVPLGGGGSKGGGG